MNEWRRLRPVCYCVALALATPTFGQEQVARKRTETLLAPFPHEVQASAVISPDVRHVAYVRKVEGGQAVVLDGQTQKAYEKVDALTFTQDGTALAYAASQGDKWWMVVKQSEQGPYERVGPPAFSPDGKILAYVAMLADGNRIVVVNNKPSGAYDLVFEGRIAFSPDGSRMVYGAQRRGQWYVIVDGRELGPYAFLGSTTGFRFSPDGKRLAFAAMATDRKWSLVIDGQGQTPHENLADVAFSPDGKRLAVAVLDGGKWRVTADRQEQQAFDAIGADTLQFSPDGAKLAYAAQAGAKWCVVVNGKAEKSYDGLADVLFSPNGRRLAYAVRQGEAEMVVLDGREQRLFDRIGGGTLVFSPNSQRLGYIARVGRARCVVIDGKRKRRYDLAGYLNFSPDSRYFLYLAVGGGKAFSVVDEKESAVRYDSIWNVRNGKIRFAPQKKFYYLAVKDGSIYAVEELVD